MAGDKFEMVLRTQPSPAERRIKIPDIEKGDR